jgi:hypothetical protein
MKPVASQVQQYAIVLAAAFLSKYRVRAMFFVFEST